MAFCLCYIQRSDDDEEEAKSTSEDDEMSDNSDKRPPLPLPKPTRAATRSTAITEELVGGLDEVKRDELAADRGIINHSGSLLY